MKTKDQKQDEIKKAEELLGGSKFLVFTEFTGVPAEDVRRLRRKALEIGAKIMLTKKRLLNVVLKNKGIDYDVRQFKSSVATIFSPDVEKGSGAVYSFFSQLGEDKEAKAANVKKILGAFDVERGVSLDARQVVTIGQLPPKEVLIAQFMGMLVGPLRAFMYILQEKAKMGGVVAEEKKEEASTPDAEQPEVSDSSKTEESTSSEAEAPTQSGAEGEPSAEPETKTEESSA